jgi:hypothetical protein
VLAKLNYCGPFDVNGMLTKEGFTFLEWTPRWGSGVTEFFCHSCKDLGHILWAIANGEDAPAFIKDGQVVALVNSREEDLSETVLDVIMAKDKSIPYLSDDSSFWCDCVAQTQDGRWVALPIQKDEHRKGRYVAHAPTFEEAISKIDSLAKQVRIAECFVDSARAQKELSKRIETVYNYVISK